MIIGRKKRQQVKFMVTNEDIACVNSSCLRSLESHFKDSDIREWIVTTSTFSKNIFDNTTIRSCDFRQSSFDHCRFKDAAFRATSLENACFRNCMFEGVAFENCNLINTIFRECKFINCVFSYSDLSNAFFDGWSVIVTSPFYDCVLEGMSLPGVFLPFSVTNCKDAPYIPMVCPDEGEFIGYKKAIATLDDLHEREVIVTLRIPEDALRSSAMISRKCRCSKAIVEKIEWCDPTIKKEIQCAYSSFDASFTYEEGKEVVPTNGFCDDRWETCAAGIHFFMNKKEAIAYT